MFESVSRMSGVKVGIKRAAGIEESPRDYANLKLIFVGSAALLLFDVIRYFSLSSHHYIFVFLAAFRLK